MDEVLSPIGLGWFQVPPILTTILIQGSYPTQHIATVFTDMPRDFKCYTSAADDENSTMFNNLCWIRNQSDTSVMGSKEHMCTEFVYDTTLFETTFSSEFNIVCEKTWLSGIFKTSGFSGLIIGCILTGIGDKWGRVSVIRAITFLYLISVLVVGLVPEMNSVIIARFMIGFCYEILNASSFTLMMEVLPIRYRSTVGAVVSTVAFAFFLIITGIVSYFIRSWRILHLTVSFPIYLLSACVFFLHKSPRWLVNKGNIEEGINVLIKGAKLNHVEISIESLDSLRASVRSLPNESGEKVQSTKCQTFYSLTSILKIMFSTPIMRTISITFPVLWFLTGVIYYSIPLNANNFSGISPFMYIIVTAMANFPPCIFIPILINILGNVKTISIMFILTMTCLVVIVFVPDHLTWLTWLAILIAMMTISSSYMIGFILGSELFPTPVRSVGFGMGGIARHAGTLTVQYVIDTASAFRMYWLPNVVTAGCCLIAGAVSAGLLPETHGHPLCESVEQLEYNSKDSIDKKSKNSKTHLGP